MDADGSEVSRRGIQLIGVPLEAGAGRGGCLMGPAALRTAGLATALRELGLDAEDRGEVVPVAWHGVTAARSGHAPAHPAPAAAPAVASWIEPLASAFAEALRAGLIPIAMGGDHSLSLGSVAGAARCARTEDRPLFVLWLDAHSDFNTPETSLSGNMHGMPLAYLCGEPGFEGVLPMVDHGCLAAERLTLFGIRSVDRAERQLLARRGIETIDMRAIDEEGISRPLGAFLERVAAANGLLHVSLDVDFLDPSIAPGVGTVVPGGATYREAHLVMELLHDSGLVTSLDVVELNPFLDDRGATARLLVDLVASLFGRRVIDRPSPGGRMAFRPD